MVNIQELVHNRKDISDLRKIIYLQQALDGDASSILGQLQPGQDDYVSAWTRINDTYENHRLLTNGICKRFFREPNLKGVSPSNSCLTFRMSV